MTRNLKALGLAFVAVCAMGAVMASAASANQAKITSTGPVTLIGTETGEPSANILSAFGGTTECDAVYTGHKAKSTALPKPLISSGDTSATITPHYTKCLASGNPATVKMTSCDFTFTLGTFAAAGTPVTADVECAVPGDEIHVEVYSDAAHTNRICTITFGIQTRTGGKLTNTAGVPDHIDLNGTFTGITAKREGLCLLDGKGTNTATGTLSTDLTIEGRNAKGEPTDVTIS